MKKIFCIGILVLLISSITAIEFAAPVTISNQEYGCVDKNQFIVDDIDNDGDDDFIPKHSNGVLWHEDSNNNGVFDDCIDMTHLIDQTVSGTLYYVDMNNDGFKDLVTADDARDLLYIYTNDGTGIFSREDYHTSHYFGFAMTIYDFNLDGIQDIIISDNSKSVYLTRPSVNDTFRVNQLNDNMLCLRNGVYNDNSNIADVNNDGYMDYIGLKTDTGQIVWYEFDPGTNSFNTSHFICNCNDYSSFIVSDMNNDGYADVIVYDRNAQTIRIVQNNQTNGFTNLTPFADNIDRIYQMESYDVNNDGLPDFELSCKESGNAKMQVYLNSTSGLQISSEITSDVTNFWIEDMNDDGELDMTCDLGGDYMIYLNSNGSFSFDNSKILPLKYVQSFFKKNVSGTDRYVIAGYYYVAEAELVDGEIIIQDRPVRDIRFFNDFDCEDIDNNGVLDYIFVEEYVEQGFLKDKIIFYLNGTRMQDIVSFASENLIACAEFNDVDNDGDFDITCYSVDDDVFRIKVYENNNCTFSNLYHVDGPSYVRRFDFSDINEDGFCDLLYTNVTGSLNLAYNLGGFSFDDPVSILSTVFSDFEYRDANGDGVKDIVTWDFNTGSAPKAYLGLSNGFATVPIIVGPSGYYRSFDFVDLDNDNDNDFLYTQLHYYDFQTVKMEVAENDGSVNLINTMLLDSSSYIFNNQILHCAADVNEDGLQDIMFIDYSSKKIKAHINTTEITPNEDTDFPEYRTQLLCNYPNPFNPETKISYSMANSGNAELTIYNIKGQRVKTLVNDHVEAGEHSIIWNGKDEKDSDVSSGVYFYRLKTADGVQNKKMLLLK